MSVYNLVLRGEITPSQGSTMNGALGVARAAIATEVEREVLERLERLEAGAPSLEEPDERPRATVTPLSLVQSRAE